ncbi:hypothetical protein F4556_000283 [Kitasatospora gansuensis]|uniref:Uncharacterized protein n=1 Tax=Kitasatospora gansuensis TaxID=258050 RepID=A0A7W7S6D7_9ACTN|nr:hypothetical protein [Kitasatospora gansuensis]MBB4944748.1 hypothetical protein [Kitasatospora gansuensis]
MTGVEVAAAMVFAWAVRRAGRAADDSSEQLGDRAYDAVTARLRGVPGVESAQAEAEQALPVLLPEVRTALERAIAEALRADPTFQDALEQLAAVVQQARGGAPLTVTNNKVSGGRFTGPVVMGGSVSGNTFAHTTNNFNAGTVVSHGDGEVNVTF